MNVLRRRGQHRYWHPIDARYGLYRWPAAMAFRCRNCGKQCLFAAIVPPTHIEDKISGGWALVKTDVPSEIRGRGACGHCGRQQDQIAWPADAYYQFSIASGLVWAWNAQYLQALRARVAGDKAKVRALCDENWCLWYFLARIPKRLVVKRHRDAILRKIDGLPYPR